MKIKPTSILQALALFALLVTVALLTGCAASGRSPNAHGGTPFFFNTSTNSIEHKGFLVTQIAVTRVLKKHPPELVTPKLIQADDDLATLEAAETISADEINEIISRLPPDTFDDPNTGLYIQGGILFFSDELETIAAQNPQQLRAAARGMRRGIKPFLPKS